ncbi:MAG: T9SS type A sorting domain-containing protein, partial [Ignavibacteria bacterium]|nr:T9SS type A sorting domain-containing protein [Ignavibacteria bacterium]
ALNAQEIPFPGFESWPGTNNNSPEGWFANNPPTGPTTVFASLNSHSGMFSAALRVLDVSGFPLLPTLSAGADGTGFPVTQRHEALNGWFEFTPLTGEFFDVLVSMWSGGPGGTLIGVGNFSTSTGTTDYTQFSAPINYNDPGTPDWCSIIIIIGINVSSTGAQAVVDDLSFGSASSVEPIENGLVPDQFELTQNYPNPFNPTTNIEYSIPEGSFVDLKIYDVLGNEIETLVSEEQAAGVYRADFNAVGLTSGFYIARISAGNFSESIKMTLMK